MASSHSSRRRTYWEPGEADKETTFGAVCCQKHTRDSGYNRLDTYSSEDNNNETENHRA